MRIGILGAGSIGTLFGTLLYRSGNDVILYNRNRTIVSSVRTHGVKFTETDGRRSTVKIPIASPPRTLREQDLDLVFVTVKAYDTIGVARKYAGKIDDTIVLTLQNGLGNYEALARLLGKANVVAASTSEAALLVRPGSVSHMGTGKTWIGEYDGHNSERSYEITETIRKTGLKVEGTRNIRGVLWSKTIVNSAINPITALAKLPNGRISSVPGLHDIMDSVVNEGTRISRAEGIRLEPSDPRKTLRSILRSTARNKSSMLQDVELGRRTEIDQLNGTIVKVATKHRTSAPMNQLFLSLIRALETSYR